MIFSLKITLSHLEAITRAIDLYNGLVDSEFTHIMDGVRSIPNVTCLDLNRLYEGLLNIEYDYNLNIPKEQKLQYEILEIVGDAKYTHIINFYTPIVVAQACDYFARLGIGQLYATSNILNTCKTDWFKVCNVETDLETLNHYIIKNNRLLSMRSSEVDNINRVAFDISQYIIYILYMEGLYEYSIERPCYPCGNTFYPAYNGEIIL